jgi:peptidoglycan/LPS O-acetylase OafA/YrhL
MGVDRVGGLCDVVAAGTRAMTNAVPHYRADIDGLRALAIVPVVAFHAFPAAVPGGFIGVDVFFVISGYLISHVIFGSLKSGTFSFSNFYARRIRRIFPALIVVLAASLAWGWFQLFASDYARLGKHAAGGAGFVANFTFWNEAGYFDSDSEAKPLLHLWSLGIEEQFYLFWPALVYLAWKTRVNLLTVMAAVLLVSFAINVVQVRTDEVATFYAPHTRLWELLLGSTLAFTAVWGVPRLPLAARVIDADQRTQQTLRNVAAFTGLIAVAAAVFAFSEDTSFPGWRAGLPTGGTLLLIAAGPGAWINRAVLAQRPLVWIGLISYPLYLWHWPLLSFGRIAEARSPDPQTKALAILASVVLATTTYLVIERPIRFQWRGKPLMATLCVAMAAVGFWGYRVFAKEGFIGRPINRSDVAHFLDYYERIRKNGLAQAYRAECDFMDWASEHTRSTLPESCTQPGRTATVDGFSVGRLVRGCALPRHSIDPAR